MTYVRSRNAWRLAALSTVAIASYALAQPNNGLTITHPVTPGTGGTAPTEPLVVHDPYSESAHFVVRHLRLQQQGPTIHVQPGATVHAELEINEHCTSCPTPHTHILIGFQGQQSAAACAWSGLRESGGWRTERFSFIAPMAPGVYPIRVRQASTGTSTCDDGTLSYWTRDLPSGPGPESTIGVLVVENARGAVTTPATTPTTVPSTTPSTSVTGSTTTTSYAGLTTTTSATGAVSVPASAPSTISNASFEQPDVASGQSVPMSQILGWVRTVGSGIEVHDGAVGTAAAGQQWIELDGTDSSGIAADIATNAGSTYLVTLSFAARPGTGALDNRLEVRWGGEVIATLAASGEGTTSTAWTRVAFRVRATAGQARIELRDVGASNGQGTYVDDVAVTLTQ